MTSENNVQGGNARRIEGLDILRGLAILMVVFSHFVPETFKSLNGGFISSWGGGGVLLFFYLSGFLIYRNVQTQLPAVFLLRRFFKLFPAYWINIAVICTIALLFKTGVATDTKTVLSNFLMIQEFTYSPLVNKVFWTLQIEVKFYLLIAAFCYFFGARKIYYLFVLLLLTNIALYPVLHRGSTLITYLIIFFPGMAAARACAAGWTKAAYHEMLLVTAIVSLNALFFLTEFNIYQAVYATIFGGILTLVLNRNFRSGIMSFFGRISYSYYLYHTAIGYPLILFLLPFATGWIQQIVIFIFVFTTTAIIATASFYGIEKPSINFGHVLEGRLARSKNNLLNRLFQKQPVRV